MSKLTLSCREKVVSVSAGIRSAFDVLEGSSLLDNAQKALDMKNRFSSGVARSHGTTLCFLDGHSPLPQSNPTREVKHWALDDKRVTESRRWSASQILDNSIREHDVPYPARELRRVLEWFREINIRPRDPID